MSIDRIANAMRREALRARGQVAFIRPGVVDAYDPAKIAAKVRLQPDDTPTGWLPIGCAWIGNGWGLVAPPSPGDQVVVGFYEGSPQNGVVLARLFDNVNQPVRGVPSGELWLVHKSGSFFKLTNDGKASLNAQVEFDLTGPTVNVTATTKVQVTAPSIVLSDGIGTLRKMVTDAFTALYNAHTHLDPQGGQTGVPQQQMGTSHTTSIVQAD